MKHILYSIATLIVATLFISCDPIQDDKSMGEVVTSVDQINATVTAVVHDGKNTNKVKVNCTSPVSCQWTDGVNILTSTEGELTLVVEGAQTITLKAMAADGTIFEKAFNYTVEDMYYEVDPEYGYFFGTGTKTWTWAATGCFGNGGGSDTGPAWWVLNPEDIEEQCAGKNLPLDGKGATMKFVLSGKKMTKTTMTGVEYAGSMEFNMTTGSDWSKGTVTFTNTNILCGYDFNDANFAAWSTYNIIELTDDRMVLAAQEHSPNTNYWYWVFVPQE
ncbi:hypothetical protein [Dysgonomonas macrotermitis]|uniref:Uncharacterized protein n=1 Tax=Dysgonomonas macrotermitis TaxID=1346286 RepID=A0A1M4T3Q6_9BACT|nr:hypothetical protein [Dysgonomonas macrotermitis]SHE39162.1 hypothetical protein SAMN05444362_101231 [Dysgonomonas macrotermitis]